MVTGILSIAELITSALTSASSIEDADEVDDAWLIEGVEGQAEATGEDAAEAIDMQRERPKCTWASDSSPWASQIRTDALECEGDGAGLKNQNA